jgi:demethylmenaquinone methyltransferase/2-methoxy-6-polyprenyl-1,4-benzoquinol methylase
MKMDFNHSIPQKNYDRLSTWYDLFSSAEDGARRIARELIDPKTEDRILEIGVGTGRNLSSLADTGCRLAGIDLSSGMARKAKTRLIREKRDCLVSLTIGDAVHLPYPDGLFDGILSSFMLELFSEQEIAIVFTECRRVLKPGGKISMASLEKPDTPNWAVDIYEWFHKCFPNWIDCRPIQLKRLLSKNGFTILGNVRISIWGLPVQIVLAEI